MKIHDLNWDDFDASGDDLAWRCPCCGHKNEKEIWKVVGDGDFETDFYCYECEAEFMGEVCGEWDWSPSSVILKEVSNGTD